MSIYCSETDVHVQTLSDPTHTNHTINVWQRLLLYLMLAIRRVEGGPSHERCQENDHKLPRMVQRMQFPDLQSQAGARQCLGPNMHFLLEVF